MERIYLDNAATAFPKPPAVAQAVYHYMTHSGANINRGCYGAAYEVEEQVLETRELLCRLNREKGITVILITHHMDEAAMADRVVVMDSGSVVMDGTPREILVRMEELRAIGLDAPHTVELLHGLREDGFDVPLDALGIRECADAIVGSLKK